MFSYTDRFGRVTERHVANWESEAHYVIGICSLSNSERTFDRRRIVDWRVN